MFQSRKHIDMCLKVAKLELVFENVSVVSQYIRNVMKKKASVS